MNVKPILFSGPMVRAILREIEAPGTGKTQTRRVIKPRPWNEAGDCVQIHIAKSATYIQGWDGRWYFSFEHPRGGPLTGYLAQWNVGDLLWVREAWRTLHTWDCLKPSHLADDISKITYEADPERRNPLWAFGKLRPSMFMPRWASRLTLEVTGVKVERLQDISEEDARAEGATIVPYGTPPGVPEKEAFHHGQKMTPPYDAFETASASYRHLWNIINGPGAWGANPWVAAITFRPHLCNIDAFLKERAP